MNHAVILSQTVADVAQGEIKMYLHKGHFTDAELAGYYVDMMNFRITRLNTVRSLTTTLSIHNARRILGTERGWPCRTCGSMQAAQHCGQCEFTHYCDAACQMKDWKRHKNECRDIKNQFGPRHGRFQQTGWNHQSYRMGGIISGYDFDMLEHLIRNLESQG